VFPVGLEVRRPEEFWLDEDTRPEEEPRLLAEEERDEDREGEMEALRPEEDRDNEGFSDEFEEIPREEELPGTDDLLEEGEVDGMYTEGVRLFLLRLER